MLKRGNPIGIRATGQVAANIDDQMRDLHDQIQSADYVRQAWVGKQRLLIEQRRGKRRQKTIPWTGANNDTVPLIDGVLRRWKPNIVALVMQANPVAHFYATKPESVEAAKSAAQFYHWKFNRIPQLLKTIMHLADMIGQYGYAWTRQGWKYSIERKCRIVSARALFPQGIPAMVEQVNQMRQQAVEQQAAETGQSLDTPDPLSSEEVVEQILRAEYEIDENDMTREGTSQLAAAVQALLDGAEYVKIYYAIVDDDRLDLRALSPLDVITASTAGDSVVEDFAAVAHRLTKDEIRRMSRDGLFKPEETKAVLDHIENKSSETGVNDTGFDHRTFSNRQQIDSTLRSLEGVARVGFNETHREVIWEIYGKMDITGNKVLDKVVIWYHPATRMILSIIEHPYPFSDFPLVKFEFEVTSDRPYQSRGIAELLSTFQRQTDQLHNARLDAVQILLSPMFKMRQASNSTNRNIRFRPGTIIPVQDVNDLQPLVQDFRPLQHFLQEENYTKTLAEQYVGVFDNTLTQLGSAERRTATEVEAITSQISTVFGGDAGLFQQSMAQVHKQLWQLWLDFGPQEEYMRVQGNEQPIKIRKEEINDEYDIVPAGTPANTSQALNLARAREMLQIFAADPTGIIDKHELYRYYVDLMDPNLSKVMVRTLEETQAVQAVMQAAQQIGGAQEGVSI